MEAQNSKVSELNEFYNELVQFTNLTWEQLQNDSLTKLELEQASLLHVNIERKVGHLARLITELSGIEKIDVDGTEYDIWLIGLKLPINKRSASALGVCIQATNRAIGKLEDDIKIGERNKLTGELVAKLPISKSDVAKAFIAHEGETKQLAKLKDFLDALGIKYFIAEAEASDGRSIEGQVDWTQAEADFAVCLATKGKAINKNTGKHYMGLNVADELGRARQVFGNKIILLVQKGLEVHTNTRGIVYAPFTAQSMDIAFVKIIRELRNWGFIQVSKT
jgi:predicted nucleotide-binding protein